MRACTHGLGVDGQANFPFDPTSNTRHQMTESIFYGCVWSTQEEVAAAKVKRRGELQGKLWECQQRLVGLVRNGPDLGVSQVQLLAVLQGALWWSFGITPQTPKSRVSWVSGGARLHATSSRCCHTHLTSSMSEH